MADQPDNDKPLVINDGDVGIVIRADGTVDFLVAGGQENKPLSQVGCALAGAAVCILSDVKMRRLLEDRYALFVESIKPPVKH